MAIFEPARLLIVTATARARRPARLLFADLAHLWITLGVLGLAVAVCLLVRTEDGIDAIGLMLQLAGTAVVVWDVLGRWRIFRRRTPREWFRHFRAALQKPQVIEATGIASGSVMLSGTVSTVKIEASPNATVEQRIAALEEQMRQLERDSKERDAERRKAHDELRAETHREIQRLRSTLGQHADLIEQIGGSGLSWELAGAAWIVGGMVLSGFAEGIARALS